jgi:hypothetical protein
MTNQGSCGSKIRVLCMDDHAPMRQAIAAVINNEPDMLLTATAAWVHRRRVNSVGSKRECPWSAPGSTAHIPATSGSSGAPRSGLGLGEIR